MTWLILRGPITAGVEMYINVCILWLDTGSSNYISWSVLGQQLFNYNQPMTNEEMCNSKQFIISEKISFDSQTWFYSIVWHLFVDSQQIWQN